MIKLIVFDFDGTLVDTWKVVDDAIRESVGKHGYKIGKRFIRMLGDKPMREMLEHIVKNSMHLEKIMLDFIEKKEKSMHHIKRIKSVMKLKQIKQKKIILSNNLSPFIRDILMALEIDFFDEIYGADSFKNKEEKFREIIKEEGLDVREVIYIGDKPIDVVLARKVGCISVVISQKASWSPREELLEAEPDFLISDFGELKRIVEKLE